MAELAYREVYAMNAVEARKRLVRSYQELGSIRATAQLWHTSRQVVRKWVARYQAEGEAGREDRSRRPRTSELSEQNWVLCTEDQGYNHPIIPVILSHCIWPLEFECLGMVVCQTHSF